VHRLKLPVVDQVPALHRLGDEGGGAGVAGGQRRSSAAEKTMPIDRRQTMHCASSGMRKQSPPIGPSTSRLHIITLPGAPSTTRTACNSGWVITAGPVSATEGERRVSDHDAKRSFVMCGRSFSVSRAATLCGASVVCFLWSLDQALNHLGPSNESMSAHRGNELPAVGSRAAHSPHPRRVTRVSQLRCAQHPSPAPRGRPAR
jgi:hypothetical protein